MKWAGHVERIGKKGNIYRMFLYKTEWFLGTCRYRWGDNNEIDLKWAACEGVDWINLNQDKVHRIIERVVHIRN
jgi:hypothetical protein